MKEVRTRNQPTTAVRSLPIELWPTADRAAWEEACRPSIRLKRGGAASHMRHVTQRDLEKRYGLFLDSLLRSGRFDGKARAGVQVTRDNVDAYVGELKSRAGSVTVYGSIQKLRRMVQLIAPDLVLDWLIAIERELASDMRPRSKGGRVVYADVLIDAGLTLMAEAEIAKRPKLTRARMFRNGLMMALLAYCPVRLKNYAALEIGRSFVNVDGIWWIVLTAAETKEKRADERPAPEELTPFIELYLGTYRPILARGNTEIDALWLAMDGKPMSYASMGELITETTRMSIGVRVSPHLFRTAGLTTLATRAGNKPHAGGALLHHRPGPVGQEHYNRASSISAGRALASVTHGYRTK
jgi:integrase